MDDNKAMLLALGATAVAGFVALAYASSRSSPMEAPKPKRRSRRRSKRREADEDAGQTTGETTLEDAATRQDAVAGSPKRKRTHRGKRSKKRGTGDSEQAPSKVVVEDQDLVRLETKDDGKNPGSWITKKAKEKTKSPTKADSADADDSRNAAQISAEVALNGKASAVIGRGGSRIRSIEEESGAKLSIDKGSSGTATITGTAEQISVAKELVLEAISGGSGGAPTSSCTAVMELGSKAGAVIGKGGATIRQLEESTGTSLDIKKDNGMATLTIRGPDQTGVDEAQKMVQDILDGVSRDGGAAAGANQVTMDLGSRQGKFIIIGKKGAQIQELERESGARLSVNKDSNTVSISGSDDQVEKAQSMIKAVLEASSKSHKMQLSKENVGTVIGKSGATIKKIETETGARLEIERDNRDSSEITLNIVGSAEAVKAAKAMVVQVLSAPAQRTRPPLAPGEAEFTLDLGRAVGSVIGKGGANILKLQSDTGARLDIERNSTECRIVGPKKAVEAATKLVQEIVQRVKEIDDKKAEKKAKIAAAGLEVTEASADSFAKEEKKEAAGDDGNADDWNPSPEGW